MLRTQKLYPLSLWSYPICDPFVYPDIQQNKQPQEMKSMARKAVLDKCSFSCSCKSQGLTSLKTHKLQCGHNLHSSKCLQNNDCWTIGITQKKQSASVSILGNLMAGLEKLIWAQFFFFWNCHWPKQQIGKSQMGNFLAEVEGVCYILKVK